MPSIRLVRSDCVCLRMVETDRERETEKERETVTSAQKDRHTHAVNLRHASRNNCNDQSRCLPLWLVYLAPPPFLSFFVPIFLFFIYFPPFPHYILSLLLLISFFPHSLYFLILTISTLHFHLIENVAGAPLSESDLKPMDEMAAEIRSWILSNSKEEESRSGNSTNGKGDDNRERDKEGGLRESKTDAGTGAVAADDLYDF